MVVLFPSIARSSESVSLKPIFRFRVKSFVGFLRNDPGFADSSSMRFVILFSNKYSPYPITLCNTDNGISRKVADRIAKAINHLF